VIYRRRSGYGKQKRKRIVRGIVFSEKQYTEIEQYAETKMMDVKSFLKFAAKAYMDKYPRQKKQRP
jgi:hypothetical protein